MKIRLIAVGRKQPQWIEKGVQEYVRRLPKHYAFSIVEVAPVARQGQMDVETSKAREADRIRSKLDAGHRLIALDEHGHRVTSRGMASALENWQADGRNVDLLIGGADGIDGALLETAEERWSLSGLTMPHGLVRVLIAEALYRAWSITSNHPYHRA